MSFNTLPYIYLSHIVLHIFVSSVFALHQVCPGECKQIKRERQAAYPEIGKDDGKMMLVKGQVSNQSNFVVQFWLLDKHR